MLVKSDTDKLQSCQAFLGSALRTLGEPHIDCANVRIYGGDCLSLMKKLPSGVVSLTITSPPYNIGKPYEKQLNLKDYLDWCEAWIQEVFRLTSSSGAFWLNLGYFEVPGRARHCRFHTFYGTVSHSISFRR